MVGDLDPTDDDMRDEYLLVWGCLAAAFGLLVLLVLLGTVLFVLKSS